MDHTKEPWKFIDQVDGRGNVSGWAIWPDLERPYCDSPRGSRIASTPDGNTKEHKANARRIVACVNACAGIETETLESIASGGDKRPPWLIAAWDEIDSLRATLAEKTAQVEQYRATVEEVARQRNEAREQVERLREAAQGVLDDDDRSVSLKDQQSRWVARMDKLREALAATADTPRPTCAWTYDNAGAWDTECGEKWQFTDGGPEENGVKFCHGCGKRVRV